MKEWSSCAARKFQCSGEIDAVEGIALAIRGRQLTSSGLQANGKYVTRLLLKENTIFYTGCPGFLLINCESYSRGQKKNKMLYE